MRWYINPEWWLCILGFPTLVLVGWQSWETRKAAKAARDNIQIIVDKERARLSIVFPPNKPSLLSWRIENQVPIQIVIGIINDGATKAFNVNASGRMLITDTVKSSNFPSGFDLGVPKVIGNADAERPILVPITDGSISEFIMIAETELKDIKREKAFLKMMGQISYDDVFGKPHNTPFHYIWKVYGNENGGEWQDESKWVDHSSQST